MKTPVALWAGAAAFAGLLAATNPFTTRAEALTALGLAAGTAALVARLVRGRPLLAGGAPPQTVAARGSAAPWLALVVVAVAWELYCFFGGPRPAHPTLSTIYNLVARWRVAKAAVVLAWLALGWELVR